MADNNTSDSETHSKGEKEKIGLTVKDTRKGKLLTFSDVNAKGGARGMTSAEVEAYEFIEDIVSSFDTESVEPGRVGTVFVPEDGELSVEWCCEDARTAAGE
jgi:hypothetical protein